MAETTPTKEPGDRAEQGRRLARFSITPEIFVALGRGVFEVVENSLLDDAHLVGAFYDDSRHQFAVIVESERFDPVGDGEPLPEVKAPTIRRM